jgi:lipoyl(octanoyl) transferase
MARNTTLGVARLGTVEYQAALGLQDALVAARQSGGAGDLLLMLEHQHVFTLGRGADERNLLSPSRGVRVYRVSRGGQITYHGPGQLVTYPILKLEGAARDVHGYLRKLEQAAIDALSRCGIAAERVQGLTGVWVDGCKIASIGVGIRRWVTCHGLALNVSTDLGYFERIVPCAIPGCVMTSITAQGHPEISTAAFADILSKSFAAVFGYENVVEVDPRELWTLIDAPQPACEAEISDTRAKAS